MKKIAVILLLLTLFTGCNVQKPVASEITDKMEIINNDEAKEETIAYELLNTGGAFSMDDIIYFIMVDRFSDSDPTSNASDVNKDDPYSFQGGDIKGITKKLDYIKSLGATSIWITPIMDNGPGGYHGYWIYDFYKVDEHFGTLDDFKELVDEAHKRDMKIILDYIVNHTGYNSPWLSDKDKASWFHKQKNITNWTDPDQILDGWLAGLPDLDQDNPEVVNYFIDNAKWWITETGIDGFRLDTVRHVPREFWNKFAYEMKKEKSDFFLLGEVWSSNPRYLELYHKEGIDSLTNYSLYDGFVGAFSSLGDIGNLISALDKEKNFEHPKLNGSFFDNHDNPRFLSLSKENGENYLKQALTFMYTYPSIPTLYYGTEIPLDGGADPDNRRFMPWDKTEGSELIPFIQELVELRKQYLDDFVVVANDRKFIAYEISKNDKSILIVMNIDKNEKELSFDYEGSITPYGNFENTLTSTDSLVSGLMSGVSIGIYQVDK